MPVTGELPDLIITSKTQSKETIDSILKAQGYNVDNVEEQTDEIAAPSPQTTTPPNAEEQPPADPSQPEEPASGETETDEDEQPPAPVEPKKKGTAQRYKEQRDAARADLEAERIERARREGEIEALRQQVASGKPPAVEPVTKTEPPPAVIPPEPPKLELPPRPTLELPDLVEPDINDPAIDGDFDKWRAATTKATKEWQGAIEKLREAHTDKLYDWKEEVKSLKTKHENSITARSQAEAKAQLDAVTNERQSVINEAIVEGKKKYPDFEQVAKKEHGKFINSAAMQEAVYQIGLEDKQDASDMIYWIATHPDEAHELAKATELPIDKGNKEAIPPAQIEKAMRKVWMKFSKIRGQFATTEQPPPAGVTPPAVEDDDPEAEDVAPPATIPTTPPAATAPPAAKPAPAAGLKTGTPPPAKPQPMTPVGSRASTTHKRLREMSVAEVAALHPDDYRKRYEAGEML